MTSTCATTAASVSFRQETTVVCSAVSTSTELQQAHGLYEEALTYARGRQYDAARDAFEQLLRAHPMHTKGWISYAQMAKKSAGRISKEAGAEACRTLLKRATALNPTSGQLLQAQGLLELQQGRQQEAVALLQRAVQVQPELAPVLKWKLVQEPVVQEGVGR